jgi:hypothetical protein
MTENDPPYLLTGSPATERPTGFDPEIESILQEMLDCDEDITARGVIRRHSTLKAASSITRSPQRSALLAHYQKKQEEFRGWRKRLTRISKDNAAMEMVEKDLRIAELESQVELLSASHVAMIRAIGELGGFSKWAKFFEGYQSVRDKLAQKGAMPESAIIESTINNGRSSKPIK